MVLPSASVAQRSVGPSFFTHNFKERRCCLSFLERMVISADALISCLFVDGGLMFSGYERKNDIKCSFLG